MTENEGFWELLKGLDTWQVFTIALLCVIVYLIIKTDFLGKYFKSKENLSQEKLENEIEKIKNEFAEKAFKNIEAAAHHAVESLEHCIGANYYVIHDSGEDLRNVERWYAVVLRSTSFAVGVDYAKPVLLNQGFKWLNQQVRDKIFMYVPDVESHPNVVGFDAEYLKTMGVKSLALCLVKNETSVYHIISLHFDIVKPKIINPQLRKTIFEFKRSVISNI